MISGSHQQASLEHEGWRLSLDWSLGLHCRLEHFPSGTVLADGAYSYSFGEPVFHEVRREGDALILSGRTPSSILIEHRFSTIAGAGVLEEEIVLTNGGRLPLDLHDVRCGFLLPVSLAADGLAERTAQQT